jgi:hypothetical protein
VFGKQKRNSSEKRQISLLFEAWKLMMCVQVASDNEREGFSAFLSLSAARLPFIEGEGEF